MKRWGYVVALLLVVVIPQVTAPPYSHTYALGGGGYTINGPTTFANCPASSDFENWNFSGSDPGDTFATDAVPPPTGPIVNIGDTDLVRGGRTWFTNCFAIPVVTDLDVSAVYDESYTVVAPISLKVTWRPVISTWGGTITMACPGGATTMYDLSVPSCTFVETLNSGSNILQWNFAAQVSGLSLSSIPTSFVVDLIIEDIPPVNTGVFTATYS